MKIFCTLKKNNGSTLAMVLFLLFLLSTVALAVMALTGSELGMSVVASDREKALIAAQAGAEKAAQQLDAEVSQIQEKARVASSEEIKTAIANNSTKFNDILDMSNPDDIKVFKEKEKDFDDICANEYKYQFFKFLDQWVNTQKSAGGDWEISKPSSFQHEITKKITQADGTVRNETITVDDGSYFYSTVEQNDSKIPAAIFTSINSSEEIEEKKSISIISTGVYSSGGHTYKRKISAEFSVLTESNGGASEIPVSYSKLTKVRVNKDSKPEILQNKAVIAQKNIISAAGKVNINGNAVCFGTIPTTNGTDVDYTADGYKYGGFMAGMTADAWNDSKFGSNNKSIAESIKAAIPTLSLQNISGSFDIKGNAATAAYIHALYSNSSNPSKINIQPGYNANGGITSEGSSFARSVKIEKYAHFSQANFRDVYTTDDLRIDANNATVNIGGWRWAGSSNQYESISGMESKLVGLNPGDSTSGFDTSSAVVVSGDSNLNINGSIFIGGTTYFNEYTNNNKMYFSGISVLKSGSLPAEAFRIWDDQDISAFRYPVNTFYRYDNSKNTDGILGREDFTEVVNNPAADSEQEKLIAGEYDYKHKTDNQTGNADQSDSNPPVKLMNGSEGNTAMGIQGKALFNILDRAMHFKWVWDSYWKDDIGYYSYLNSGDIRIEPIIKNKMNGNDQIQGWCFGAVAANNTVYGPYGGFNGSDFVYGTEISKDDKNGGYYKYKENMSLFVSNPEQLIGAAPEKPITDWINDTVSKDTLIKSKSERFFLNSSSDVVLSDGHIGNVGSVKNSPISADIRKGDDGYMRGIIYSAGDIYVEEGTKLKGILIAKGNIVFLGGSEISYDKDTIDILLSEEPEAGRFFNYSASDIVLDNSIVKTIKKPNVKNIKIISWKEV